MKMHVKSGPHENTFAGLVEEQIRTSAVCGIDVDWLNPLLGEE
jgi:hypothetical protein